MGAEAPERVLVGAQLAEVQAVAVDVVDVAELAGVGDLLELLTPGWYSSRWPTIRIAAGALGRRDRALGVGDRLRQRLLDEAVLAGLEHPRGEPAWVGTGVAITTASSSASAEQLVEVGREPRAGEARPQARRGPSSRVAAPGQLGAGERGRSCARGSGPSSRGRRRRP